MGAEGEIERIKWTVADYHRMAEVGLLAPDARVELIDGEIVQTAPIDQPVEGAYARARELAAGDRISILALPTIGIDVAELFNWSGR
jgi:hypothetical protein